MSSPATSSADDPVVPPPSAPAVAAEAPSGSEDANGQSPPRQKQGSDAKRPPSTDLRIHAAIATVLAVAAVAFSQVGPSIRTVVNFFWPLLVSTGVFLAAVAVLRVISPPQPDGDAADKAGTDLMDFVAGGSVGGHEERGEDGAAAAKEEGAKDGEGKEEEH